MARNHLKRLAMPTTWITKEKKRVTWVARTNPGAHSLEEGMPLVLVLREMLGYASTTREAKRILQDKAIMVDGIRRRDHRFNIGFMDVISIPDLKESYRISISKHGKLQLIKIDDKEAKSKLVKIKGKTNYEGKIQLGLSDGRNILVDKGDYKTGDSLVISVPEQKIAHHIKFEKGSLVLLTGGKKIGAVGMLEEIKENIVTIKTKKETFATDRKYCFVIGKNEPMLTIE